MPEANCDIACPGFKRWVKGIYDTDPSGKYLVGENGTPMASRTFCFNEGNTCPHTACLLHRAGKGTTAPSTIKLYPNTTLKVQINRGGTGKLTQL